MSYLSPKPRKNLKFDREIIPTQIREKLSAGKKSSNLNIFSLRTRKIFDKQPGVSMHILAWVGNKGYPMNMLDYQFRLNRISYLSASSKQSGYYYINPYQVANLS